MKLVIDISEGDYKSACKREFSMDGSMLIYNAIREGTEYKERPHGEWEFIGDNLFKCTHCGYIADAYYLREWKVHTYDAEFPTACLKCGADMRKEGESE